MKLANLEFKQVRSETKGASSSLTLFTLSRALTTSRTRCFLRSVDTDGLLQPTTSTSVSVDVRVSARAHRRIARVIGSEGTIHRSQNECYLGVVPS